MDTQKDKETEDSALLAGLSRRRMVVGVKQLRKALLSGKAERVLLARDADPAITGPIEALCQLKSVACAWVGSMTGLGRACGIEVGAAAAAVLREV